MEGFLEYLEYYWLWGGEEGGRGQGGIVCGV